MSKAKQTEKSEQVRLEDQVHRSYSGGAWHGPSLTEVLDGVDAALASRSSSNAHSIWEIVRHVTGCQAMVAERLDGNSGYEYPDGDWPEVADTTPEAWKSALSELEASNERLRNVIAGLSPAHITETDEEGKSWRYENILGLIQHNIYHAGQIALLRKS